MLRVKCGLTCLRNEETGCHHCNQLQPVSQFEIRARARTGNNAPGSGLWCPSLTFFQVISSKVCRDVNLVISWLCNDPRSLLTFG